MRRIDARIDPRQGQIDSMGTPRIMPRRMSGSRLLLVAACAVT